MDLPVLQLERIAVDLHGRDRAARRDAVELEGRPVAGPVGQAITGRGRLALIGAELEAGIRHALQGARRQLETQSEGVGDLYGRDHGGKARGPWRGRRPLALDRLLQDLPEKPLDRLLLRDRRILLRPGPALDHRAQAVTPVDQELPRGDSPGRRRFRRAAGEIVAEQRPAPGIVVAADGPAQLAQEPGVDQAFALAPFQLFLELVDQALEPRPVARLRLGERRPDGGGKSQDESQDP